MRPPPDNFYDLAWAIAVVLEELGLKATPKGLEDSLEATAGHVVGAETQLVYRPYLQCASRVGTQGKYSEAEGAKYRTDARAKEYRRQQAELDTSFGLIVPPGSEAVLPPTVRWPFSGSVKTVVGL